MHPSLGLPEFLSPHTHVSGSCLGFSRLVTSTFSVVLFPLAVDFVDLNLARQRRDNMERTREKKRRKGRGKNRRRGRGEGGGSCPGLSCTFANARNEKPSTSPLDMAPVHHHHFWDHNPPLPVSILWAWFEHISRPKVVWPLPTNRETPRFSDPTSLTRSLTRLT